MTLIRDVWTPKKEVEEIAEEARALGPELQEWHELDCGTTVGYWVRGHHDLRLFLDAVDWAYEIGIDGSPSGLVYRTWWRCVPIPDSWESVCVYRYIEAPGPGRGAFAVTAVEL